MDIMDDRSERDLTAIILQALMFFFLWTDNVLLYKNL